MTHGAKAEKLARAAKHLRAAIAWIEEVDTATEGATAPALEVETLKRIADHALRQSDTHALIDELESED
jgi:hypothetical protein